MFANESYCDIKMFVLPEVEELDHVRQSNVTKWKEVFRWNSLSVAVLDVSSDLNRYANAAQDICFSYLDCMR